MADSFFRYEGKKIPLSPVDNVVVVRYKNSISHDYARYAISLKLKPNVNMYTATEKSYPSHHLIVITLPASGKADEVTSGLVQDENVEFISKAYKEPTTGILVFLTDEIIVKFKEKVDDATISRILSENELDIIKKSEFPLHQYLVRVRKVVGSNTLDIANKLADLPELEFAEPNFANEAQKDDSIIFQSSKFLDQQWHLRNTGQNNGLEGEDINALEAWKLSAGGSESVVIAILDDGVDISHPDLKDNMWKSSDQNSPEIHGYNFVNHTTDPNPVYFSSPFNESSHNDIHGTACAGVAAASGYSGGPLGIAYKCKILPVKVFGENSIVADLDLSDAIAYAGKYADIINLSFFTKVSNVVTNAIRSITSSERKGVGCVVVAASGNGIFNQDSLSYPASLDETIAVGASTNQGLRANYSQYGPGLDFIAPSSGGTLSILTTDVNIAGYGYNYGQLGQPDTEGKYTNSFGGTSAAAPLAAGVAALVLSVNPNLKPEEVRDILRKSCDKIDKNNAHYDNNGFSITHGFGRLNARRALELANTFNK